MNAKEIVGTLRTLAAEPANRGHIVRDQGCLPGLVIFLTDKDSEVIFTALEVVYFLSLHADNRAQMASEPGLLKNVKKLMVTGSLREKKVAIQAYTNLQSYAAKEPKPESSSEANPISKVADQENIAPDNSRQIKSGHVGVGHKLVGKPGVSVYGDSVRTRAANTFTIYVSGLNTEDSRSQIEALLLKIKGVISFFFDLCEQKVVIRSTLSAEDVIERIASSGWKASTSKKDVVAHSGDLSKDTEPAYLDESNAVGSTGNWFGFGAITLFGAETAEDRKSRLDKQAQGQNGWLSKLKLW